MLELGVISKVSVWLLEQVCSHVRFVNVFARMWMFGRECVERSSGEVATVEWWTRADGKGEREVERELRAVRKRERGLWSCEEATK